MTITIGETNPRLVHGGLVHGRGILVSFLAAPPQRRGMKDTGDASGWP